MIVADNRGLKDGYSVTVQATKMKRSDGVRVLVGNNIKLTNPTVTPIDNTVSTLYSPTVNESFYVDAVDLNGNSIPTVVEIAPAKKAGLSVGWTVTWNDSHISLNTAPGVAAVGNYQTIITWTLNDVPEK
ncbi:hypothetical protein AZF37_09300 [endosymbiont 'TC1' of Trimyema compressum]|nr:hypothetical protein AZF37_09300 [endosymbiont 'TC1' of Trimyema compressum]